MWLERVQQKPDTLDIFWNMLPDIWNNIPQSSIDKLYGGIENKVPHSIHSKVLAYPILAHCTIYSFYLCTYSVLMHCVYYIYLSCNYYYLCISYVYIIISIRVWFIVFRLFYMLIALVHRFQPLVIYHSTLSAMRKTKHTIYDVISPRMFCTHAQKLL